MKKYTIFFISLAALLLAGFIGYVKITGAQVSDFSPWKLSGTKIQPKVSGWTIDDHAATNTVDKLSMINSTSTQATTTWLFATNASTTQATTSYLAVGTLASTTRLLTQFGSVSSPSVSFSGQLNSGLYVVDGNSWAISNLGTEVMDFFQGNIRAFANVRMGGTTGALTWGSSSVNGSNADTGLSRLGVAGVAVGNASALGNTAGTLFTDGFASGTSTPGSRFAIAATSTKNFSANNILLSGINFVYASSSTTTIPSSVNAFTFATSTATGTRSILSIDGSSNWGRVGIATNTPGNIFAVGSSTATSTIQGGLIIGNNDPKALTIQNTTGSVGIGITNFNANTIFQVGAGASGKVSFGGYFQSGDFYTYEDFGSTDSFGSDSPNGTVLAVGGFRASPTWVGMTFHSSGYEDMRIKGIGRIGMGTSSPAWNLQVASSSAATLALSATTSAANLKHWLVTSQGGSLSISTSSDLLATSSAPALRIDSNDHVYMPGLSQVNTTGTNGNVCWLLAGNGELVVDATTCLISAAKFKKDIKDLNIGLEELLKLRPVSYQLKNPSGNMTGEQIGFIADEAQKVDPRLITLDVNGEVHSFRYEQYTSLITKAIQQFYGQFQALVARVAGVEKRLDDQQKTIDSLTKRIEDIENSVKIKNK